jgi:predicted permease
LLIGTLRALRRAPWYSATIVGVVALGMALATTVFAVVDGVLFRPLPYPDADRLYTVLPGFTGITPGLILGRFDNINSVGTGDVADWSAAAPEVMFTGFSAQRWGGFGTGVNDDTSGVARVQPNFFDVVGVRPLVGGFAPEDFQQESPVRPVIILHDIWQRRFQGEHGIIGRTVEIDPLRHGGYRVVGVMPAGFTFPSAFSEVRFIAPYLPSARDRANPYNRSIFEVIARLPPSMSTAQFKALVETGVRMAAANAPPQGPKPAGWSDRGWRMQGPYDRADVMPLSAAIGRRMRPLFSGVFLAAILLVALAALNVSALMAARTLDRGRELGLRRALGASARTIAGLMFTETVVLIAIGALAGLALVPPLLRLALALLPEETVLLKTPGIDWRVAMFLLVGVIALAIPTSFWPIRRALRAGVSAGADAGRVTSRRSIGRYLVVASQVAGAFVLIVIGGLLVSSLLTVYANERPIRTDGVVVIAGNLLGPGGDTTARLDPILNRLKRIPGVTGTAATDAQLLVGGNWPPWFTPPPSARRVLEVNVQGVTADYFQMLELQLVSGRLPAPAELAANTPIIVVSEALARAYWPDAPAVGQVIGRYRDTRLYTVVGVVRDVRWFAWDLDIPSIYAPYELVARYSFPTLLIRTDGRTGQVIAEALKAVREVDPLMQIRTAMTLDDLFVDSVRTRRFKSWLFGSFAVAGLVVVGVGILGLIAMSTARRTKEIGIRYVLGSTRRAVIALILREQLAAVVTGLVAGGLVSAWAVTFVTSYLYGVTASDPRVWTAAAVLMVTTAAMGALVPAIRASRTDPVGALRAE